MIEINGIKLYTMAEVATLMGTTRYTVSKYMKGGGLRSARIGGRYYISEEALKDYLNGKP